MLISWGRALFASIESCQLCTLMQIEFQNSTNQRFHGCVRFFSREILWHLLFLLPDLPLKCELRLKVGLKVLLCQIRLLRRTTMSPSSLFCYLSLLVTILALLMRVQIKKLSKLFFSLFYFFPKY